MLLHNAESVDLVVAIFLHWLTQRKIADASARMATKQRPLAATIVPVVRLGEDTKTEIPHAAKAPAITRKTHDAAHGPKGFCSGGLYGKGEEL